MKRNAPIRPFRARAGWTVVEMLIGLTVIAVIIMVSAPRIDALSQGYYLRNTSSNLLSSLTLAQSEATQRGSIGRLCPSSDGKSCRPDGNWNRGWIVFLDSNANKKPEPAEVLNVFGPPKGEIRIEANGSFSSSVDFTTNGSIIRDNQQTGSNFRICYGDERPGAREIHVYENGRVATKKSDQPCGET